MSLFVVTRLDVEEPVVAVVGVAHDHAGAVATMKADIQEHGSDDELDDGDFAEIPDDADHIEAHGGLTIWNVHEVAGTKD